MERREHILDIAVSIADERGLDAVSMRSVAERVGVTPMALYPHVGSKAALLDGMVGRLLIRLVPDTEAGAGAEAGAAEAEAEGVPPWRDRLSAIAHGARDLATRHPWVAALLFSRPSVAPDSVRAIDLIYAALLDAGVPEPDVPRLERMLSTFVLAYGASEAGGRFGPGALNPRGRRGQLPEGALPAHARLAEALDRPPDWDAEFEADLDDLGLLIEAVARRASAPGPAPAGAGIRAGRGSSAGRRCG
jgi:AcrR family transcriptional regulator